MTGNQHYAQRAEEIGEFLLRELYVDGRLMRSWQGGRARHLAVGADHAWLIEACLRLVRCIRRALICVERVELRGAAELGLVELV